MVFDSIGCWECTWEFSGFDDCSASLLDGGDEVAFEPLLISFKDFRDRLIIDSSMGNIRELCRRMVSPNDDVLDWLNSSLCSSCDLKHGSVVVETCKCAEVFFGNFGSELRESQTIGVGRVSDHKAAAGWLGDLVKSGPLFFEDFRIDLKELLPLHSLLAGETSNKNTKINVLENLFWIRAHDDSFQQRISAVV